MRTATSRRSGRSGPAQSARVAPTPPGHWLTGHLRERYADPLGLFLNSQRRYGDVVRYRMATLPVLQFTHPDQVGEILRDTDGHFVKGESWAKTRPLIGEGLVTSEGAVWREQRRRAEPAFHAQRLAALGSVLAETIDEQLDDWQRQALEGRPVMIFAASRRLTLTLVIKALFGLRAGEHSDQVERAGVAFPAALEITNRRLSSPLPYRPAFYRLPTPANRAFGRARHELESVITALVSDRQRLADAGDTGLDLLGLLIEAFETRDTEDDQQFLRDQVMTLFLAGFETTATTLTWAMSLLSDHPDEAERVRAEVDQVLDGRRPTAADLRLLPRLRAVLDETLRLYPPVWAIPRSAVTDTELAGYPVPAGRLIIVVPYVTHRHPEFWTEPERFDPDRFVRGDGDRPRTGRHRYAYLPFGAGQRKCLGNNLAIMEAMFALSMIIQRFDWRILDPPVVPDPYVTLRPRGEVPMELSAR